MATEHGQTQESPTPEELAITIKTLRKFSPGFLPRDIFTETSRITVVPILEIVPARINPSQKVEVLFLLRPDDDPYWPNQFHTPGTVIKATDETYQTAIRRITQKELEGELPIARGPEFVTNFLHKQFRGWEDTKVYWAELTQGQPRKGIFFEQGNFPNNAVQTQIPFINLAIEHYLDTRSKLHQA